MLQYFKSNKREREREREREQCNLKPSLNSVNDKNLGDLILDSSDLTQDSINSAPLYPRNTNKSNIALCKSGGLK